MNKSTYECNDCLSSYGCIIIVQYEKEKEENGFIENPPCVCCSARVANFRLVGDKYED